MSAFSSPGLPPEYQRYVRERGASLLSDGMRADVGVTAPYVCYPPSQPSSPVKPSYDHGKPMAGTSRKYDANERASLDRRFLSDLWLLLHLSSDGHPLPVLLNELACIVACTALALWLLPIPSYYVAVDDGRRPFIAFANLLVLVLAFAWPLRHAIARPAPAAGHVRRRALTLLFLCVQLYNVAGFFISIVPSLIYQALASSPRQCAALPALMLKAVGYICAVTACKALVSVAQSSTALLWRGELTRIIHERYVHRGAHYHLTLLCPSIDNPDQRIARELELWSLCLAGLMVTVSTSLFNIIWYTAQTWLITGWQGPAIIYMYFIASAAVTRLVASPVAALTARVQASEGDFRTMHAMLLQSSEATAMCSDGDAEGLYARPHARKASLRGRPHALRPSTQISALRESSWSASPSPDLPRPSSTCLDLPRPASTCLDLPRPALPGIAPYPAPSRAFVFMTSKCAPSGRALDRALGESFAALLSLRWQLIFKQASLSAVTFFCDYMVAAECTRTSRGFRTMRLQPPPITPCGGPVVWQSLMAMR